MQCLSELYLAWPDTLKKYNRDPDEYRSRDLIPNNSGSLSISGENSETETYPSLRSGDLAAVFFSFPVSHIDRMNNDSGTEDNGSQETQG